MGKSLTALRDLVLCDTCNPDARLGGAWLGTGSWGSWQGSLSGPSPPRALRFGVQSPTQRWSLSLGFVRDTLGVGLA